MSARLLDGKKIAQELRAQIKERVDRRLREGRRPPGLAVLKVGHEAASEVYVRKKRQARAEAGFRSFDYDLPLDATQEKLLSLIDQMNDHPDVDGILVQLPLPKQIDQTTAIERISPSKDLNGFPPFTIGPLAQRIPRLRPFPPPGFRALLPTRD